ncbi:MAG: hypothetical protein COB81_03375 [Flavobacteriaceae bacterium]|nr:MAG: hypothetical protein COB81_03375 [Flavobacteriaceae bacterium]
MYCLEIKKLFFLKKRPLRRSFFVYKLLITYIGTLYYKYMRKIDFTQIDDIREFSQNYGLYKEQVSLPEDVHLKIAKVNQVLEFQIITKGEAESRIVSIIITFMESLR